MNRSIFSRLTGQISPGQCIAPFRPPGSPPSWWRGPCTHRRGHHIMFRDIVKYCFKASLCLSCFSAEDTSCYADSWRRRLVLEVADADFLIFTKLLPWRPLQSLSKLPIWRTPWPVPRKVPWFLPVPYTPRQLEVWLVSSATWRRAALHNGAL